MPESISLKTHFHCPLSGDELDDAVSDLNFQIGFFHLMVASRGLDDDLAQASWREIVSITRRLIAEDGG